MLLLFGQVTEILCAQPTEGLAGYFNFNGNTTNSGSSSIITSAFNTAYSINNAGTPNSTIQFSGTTSSYLSFTDNGNLDFTGDFSIAFAIYTPTLASSQGFYDNGLNYGGCGIWYFSADNTLRFNFRSGSISATAALSANQWTPVCAIRSGSTLKLYVNGVLVSSGAEGSSTISYPYMPLLGQMYFAAGSGNYNPVANGAKMDELRFYGRALTDAEVLSLVPFALPLKLLEFNTELNGNNTILSWKTDNEVNTLEFIIEKSLDGSLFTSIGTVASQNTAGIHQYSFTDAGIGSLGGDMVYYRLKQTDIDGHFTYSRIIALPVNSNKAFVMLYPNPASSELNISMSSSETGKIKYRIVDINGRTVRLGARQLLPGANSFTIDISKLVTGSYYLHLDGNSVHKQLQFIK